MQNKKPYLAFLTLNYKTNDAGTSDEVAENYVKFYNEHYPELFVKKEDDRKLH